MEWRSSDGRVILLLGDSVEMIPRLKELDVAAVATDPPYESCEDTSRLPRIGWKPS